MSKQIDTIQLELKDRLNYPYIITRAIFSIETALSDSEYDADKLEGLIMALFYKIPDTWKSKEFDDEINNAKEIKTYDVRPRYGTIPLDIKICKKMDIKIYEKREEINYFKIYHAIINLLDRLGMLVRKEKIERSTGKNLDAVNENEESLDDLIDKENENEQ